MTVDRCLGILYSLGPNFVIYLNQHSSLTVSTGAV